jgi:3-oxoacyl-[acyl-carrier protein] reductase
MNLGIEGKVALVTAASQGLGRGCAHQLAIEKCRVAICSRDTDRAREAAAQIANDTGAQVVGFGFDVSRPLEVKELLNQVRATLGDPEILVTNAGGPPPGTFASTPLEAYPQAIDLNLMSAVHLIHGVVPAMQSRQWGRIIAITSISVKQPIGHLLLSNMARAGLTGFLKTIATELASFGITVNALLPGIHRTARVDQLAQDQARQTGQNAEAVLRQMMDAIPSKTIGDPMDFGAAAAFLASVQARFITGQNILLDGGAYGGML